MFRFIKSLCKGRWTVVRCCWPHPAGYATYHRRSNTVLDTGLDKDEAKEECRKLNGRVLEGLDYE